jgi:ATP-binding protein involved in chromosome partitioning
MSLDQQAVLNAVQTVLDPNTGKDFVSTKALKNLQLSGSDVSFDVELGYPAKSQIAGLRKSLIAAVKGVPGVGNVRQRHIQDRQPQRAARRAAAAQRQEHHRRGFRQGRCRQKHHRRQPGPGPGGGRRHVGLLDADIYGPSQPMMMGIEGRPESVDGKNMEPMENYGIQVMSIGFLVAQDEAMIWRGPMATQALEQLLRQTNWKDLDYLIVDMPPGTGDIQLTLSQRVPMTGAVIVTTPQDIALLDAKKGIKMFEKVGVPILGIVENMAVHICSNCGHAEHIFGEGGGKKMAADYKMDYLGALPLDMQIRLQADNGRPTVVADPDGEVAGIYKAVARKMASPLRPRPRTSPPSSRPSRSPKTPAPGRGFQAMNLLASLRYLAALDEHKHFGRAAQACNITQPALVQRLARAGSEFGAAIVGAGATSRASRPKASACCQRPAHAA